MTFRVPKLNSCCCLSLSTGTKIIAVLHLVWVVFAFAVPFIMIHPAAMQDTIGCVSVGCLAALLLYGDQKEYPHSMFPWLLYHTIYLIYNWLSVVTDMVFLGLTDYRSPVMGLKFIATAVQAFYLLIVYNRYREIKGTHGLS